MARLAAWFLFRRGRKRTAKAEVAALPGQVSPLASADRLRDAGQFAAAASLYAEAHAREPGRHDILVQLGNMLKDSGDLAGAELAYRQSLSLADRADTRLQLGHVLKLAGDRVGALACYRDALALDPGLPGAVRELAEMGDQQQQARIFEAGLQHGSLETLLALGKTLSSMRAELDRLGRLLPDAAAAAAFPVSAYQQFRALFPVPSPDPAPEVPIAVILLAERESVATLFQLVASVQAQRHASWTLSVIGHDPDRRRVVSLAASADARITWVEAKPEDGLAATEHAACLRVTEGWLLLLAQGARLDPNALGWFAAASRLSDAAAFACDEEAAVWRYGALERSAPTLRATIDYDSLLEANTAGETLAVRADAFRQALPPASTASIAGTRAALLLALAQHRRVGHVPLPLVWRDPAATDDGAGHAEGVAAHLAHNGLAATVALSPGAHPCWAPSRPDDVIAVLIPTRNNAPDCQTMAHSLRQSAANPVAIEIIIIDNGTDRAPDLAILAGLAAEPGVRVLQSNGPFNWSYLNNLAAAETIAPLLVFANDDMRMVSLGWDARLRGLLERDDVGAVGARLLYGDDTIQHAGILMGWQGSVIHDGLHEPADAPGPDGRWHHTRRVSAVTGAFLATTRQHFQAAGGFDGKCLPVAYSDVDYALRLRAAGLTILWSPAITLYHHETRTRGRDHTDPWRTARNGRERAVMAERWGDAMQVEPGASPLWQAYTMPFRMIAAPSKAVLQEAIVRSGGEPWRLAPPTMGQGTGGGLLDHEVLADPKRQ